MITRKCFTDLTEAILDGGAIQAIKYFSPVERVKATRKLLKGKIDKRYKSIEILFTIGKPSSKEMMFVKKCIKAKEPFPIKKIQMRFK